MSGKIRANTLKNVVILIFSILIALAISFYFSQKVYAEEPLPVASAEADAANVNTAGEEDFGDAAGKTPSAAPAQTEVNENADIGDGTDSTAGTAEDSGPVPSSETGITDSSESLLGSETGSADGTAGEADTENVDCTDCTDGSGNAEIADGTAGEADTENVDCTDGTDGTGDSGNAEIADGTAGETDTENADVTDGTDGTGNAEIADGTAGETDTENADVTDGTADTENAEIAYATVDAAKSSGTENTADSGMADGEDRIDGSKVGNPAPKAGNTIDPLIYLSECLQYHGDETDPSAYSLRAYTKDGQSIVTPVKDQTPWLTCWGFSAIAASEISILSECYAKWDQLAPGLKEKYGIETFAQLCEWLNLSERQLAWFAYTPEPENGNYPTQAGEGLYAREKGIGAVFNALGVNYFATSVFSRGTGPIEESRVPYQNNEGALNDGIRIIAKDGTVYTDLDYLGAKTTTGLVEYVLLIPKEMTKEDVINYFNADPNAQEAVRQRLEEGVKYGNRTCYVYEDDNGKYYYVACINELKGIMPDYPEILAFKDQDGNRYEFDPDTKTIPGLPPLHIAYYDWSVDESLHYASIVELESSDILPKYYEDYKINENTIKAIKKELREGRGVSIAFYADTAAPGESAAADYINMANNAWAHYTYNNFTGSNHEVTIVGYNDNFPRTAFLEGHEPPKDGAWLVKNSWGGGKSQGADFGNWGIDENGDGIGDGYFWLSYWDSSINNIETFNYKVENLVSDRAEYDIRQYDLMTSVRPMRVTSDKEANVFTAEATTNIREIGVQHSDDQTTVTYEIYHLNDGATDPTDGVLLASGSEHYEYSGYHRIKTDKTCIIPKGSRYSVIVTQEREGKQYISVYYAINEQCVIDKEKDGESGIKSYSKAVVNKGESYVLYNGQWMDWVDFIPSIQHRYATEYMDEKENWIDVDNFSIKVYADFITEDLLAEATEISSGDPASTVGVSGELEAENTALISLVSVYEEISNNTAAEKAACVNNDCITAEDYSRIAQTLVDPNRDTGLKVVVLTVEIPASDIDGAGLKKLLNAANEHIARYADISLLVMATDNGEYLGSLHKTENPIELAMAIPEDLLVSDNTVYVLRLHDGNVERLATIVRDGRVYFESDLFSKFALAYDETDPENDPIVDPEPKPDPDPKPYSDPKPDPDHLYIDSGKDLSNGGKTNTGIKESVAVKVIPAKTGDASGMALWLALMFLAAGAALNALFLKKTGRLY